MPVADPVEIAERMAPGNKKCPEIAQRDLNYIVMDSDPKQIKSLEALSCLWDIPTYENGDFG